MSGINISESRCFNCKHEVVASKDYPCRECIRAIGDFNMFEPKIHTDEPVPERLTLKCDTPFYEKKDDLEFPDDDTIHQLAREYALNKSWKDVVIRSFEAGAKIAIAKIKSDNYGSKRTT